ncbi:hypothetical protein JQN09_14830 [Phocaeicola dorei]|uniref:hypothetical protein n=1 Tax=Phocaeicola dorei TaxID=357276 RepID=UPI001BDEFF0E|nr:hypothetical protein [Phocaeicola dorei]MBT1313192.1 hypothetical protein [Phocaeicola dorei]
MLIIFSFNGLLNICLFHPSIRERFLPTDHDMLHPLFRPVTYPLSHPSVNGRSVGHDIPITVISDIASTIRTDNGSIKQYDHYTIIGSAVSSVHAANKKVFFHTGTMFQGR